MYVEGTALLNGGKTHTTNKVTIGKDLYVEGAADVTFDDCVYVLRELDFKSSQLCSSSERQRFHLHLDSPKT